MNNIIEYLNSRNYLVRIKVTEGGCVATFPAQCLALYTEDDYSVEFIVDWKEGTVVINSLNTQKTYQPPTYLIPTLILHCISFACSVSLYSPELICFEIDNRRVDENYWMEYCFSDHMSTEDHVMSGDLLKIVLKAQQNGWTSQDEDLAKEHNVLDGYKFMKNILRTQDILNA